MADGPCGEEFKAAFSCFVYSEAEPKGMDCVEKFKGMQDCFRLHPEIYGEGKLIPPLHRFGVHESGPVELLFDRDFCSFSRREGTDILCVEIDDDESESKSGEETEGHQLAERPVPAAPKKDGPPENNHQNHVTPENTMSKGTSTSISTFSQDFSLPPSDRNACGYK